MSNQQSNIHPLAFFLVTLLLAPLAMPPAVASDSLSEHRIDLTGQQIRVHSTLQAGDSGLVLRRSADGDCQASAEIVDLSIRDSRGEPLEWQVTDTASLAVETTRSNESISLSYRLRLPANARTRMDRDFAILDLQDWLLLPDAPAQPGHHVALQLPGDWPHSLAALERHGQHGFVAQHRQQLWSSPIIAGNMLRYRFEIDGQRYELVNLPDNDLWNGEQVMADLQRLLHSHQSAFSLRFDSQSRYLLINLFDETQPLASWPNASVIGTSVWSQRDPQAYPLWLQQAGRGVLQSHLPRIGPDSLRRGLVDYFSALQARRAGLLDHQSYLETLARQLQHSPNNATAFAQSSCQQTPEMPDVASVMILDASIRQFSEGAHSLDSLLNRPSPQTVQSAPGSLALHLAGLSQSPQLAQWLRQYPAEALPLESALHGLGLKLRRPIAEPRAWLGVPVENQGGRLFVAPLKGQEHNTELQAGDELLALDGYRVSADQWRSRLRLMEPGDQTVLLYARRDEIRQLSLTLVSRPSSQWRLTPLDDDQARQRNNDWMDGR